ncbi:MAG: hypothetical protein ACRD6B_18360 [Bryobacteraceae bacterium]
MKQTRAEFGLKKIVCLLSFLPVGAVAAYCQQPDVQTIIQRSVQANQRDFVAAPNYSYDECDKVAQGTRTYRVMMIDGSPYNRLIAVNKKPLPEAKARQQEQQLQQEIAKRKSESAGDRKKRIASYENDRKRDHTMLDQMALAFNFELLGNRKLGGRDVYYLKATPRPGYKPPSMDAQVLPGMTGHLWIDRDTFQWVKVTARVMRPVTIEGFLAQVEPGTNFELEMMPVGDGIWLEKHYSMHSHSKVLFLFSRSSSEEEWYSNYKRVSGSSQETRASR